MAEEVLEEDLQGVGEPGDVVVGEAGTGEREDLEVAVADARVATAMPKLSGWAGVLAMTSFCPLVDQEEISRARALAGIAWGGVRRWAMDDVRSMVEQRLAQAFDAVSPGADPVVRPSERADLQANGAIAVARSLGRDPVDVARAVVEVLDIAEICEEIEVSGNGFINLTYSREFLAARLGEYAADDRLGIDVATHPETVVVDYSGPNVAKEMHVGHLRTTVIGDAAGSDAFVPGSRRTPRNHIGDRWGTPFGMLVEHLVDMGEERGRTGAVDR